MNSPLLFVRPNRLKALAFSSLLLVSPAAFAATTLLGGNSTGDFFSIRTDDGTTTVLNPGGPLPSNLTALARDSSGVIYGGDTVGNLFTLNVSTGASTVVNPSNPVPGGLVSMAFAPDGVLWAGNTSGALFTINPGTWTVGTVHIASGFPSPTAMDFASDGTLWAGNQSGHLMTVDTSSIAVTVLHTLATPLDALAFDAAGTLFGGNGPAGNLFSIDPGSGAVDVVDGYGPVPNGIFSLTIPEPSLPLLGAGALLALLGRRRR